MSAAIHDPDGLGCSPCDCGHLLAGSDGARLSAEVPPAVVERARASTRLNATEWWMSGRASALRGSQLQLGCALTMMDAMDKYSHRMEREACGALFVKGRRQFYQPMVNVASATPVRVGPDSVAGGGSGFLDPRHNFVIDPGQFQQVVEQADREGFTLFGIAHSHPFAAMGSDTWVAPSLQDVREKMEAEMEGFADVETMVWCPSAGAAGILVGYDGSGKHWAWTRPGTVS